MSPGATTIAIAIVLALSHLLSRHSFRVRARFEPGASSLSAGIATAYVFLHLLPEIDLGHEAFGERIYLVVLAGFLLFYGSETLFERMQDYENRRHPLLVRLIPACIYSAVFVYTVGEQIPENPVLGAVYLIGLGTHMMSMDHALEEHFGDHFGLGSRLALALSAGLGAVVSIFTEYAEHIVDFVTALLVGFIMLNVFREELPSGKETSFRWFFLGILAVLTTWGASA